MGLFRKRNWNYHGWNKKTCSYFDEDGFDIKGYDENGYDKKGYNGMGYDENGYDKKGYNENGFNKEGINKKTKTKFNEKGFDIDGYDETGHDEYGCNKLGIDKAGYDRYGLDKDGFDRNGFDKQGYDKDGFDRNGLNEQGYDKDGFLKFKLTENFVRIILENDSEFSRIIAIAYNEKSKMKSKSFFSHNDKIGIYSKEYETYTNQNIIHVRISKSNKQDIANWIKPKDTGKIQGDNFESGYTLEINFEKNEPQFRKYLIDNLNKIGFGSLPSEYSITCHYDEKYPNDKRAKELLDRITGLFE